MDNPRIHAGGGSCHLLAECKDSLFLFLILYIVLGVMCIFVLRRLFRNKPAEAELEELSKEKQIHSMEKGEPL